MSTQVSQAFDPYHRWLGIPPKDQPPHHYRLLGIEAFEEDADVIESAADRQMKHVRSFQTGSRSRFSQQLLNELSTAKVCLLDPEKKAAYDQQLRGRLTDGDAVKPSATGQLQDPPVPPLPMGVPVTPLDPLPTADPLADVEPFPSVALEPPAPVAWNAPAQPAYKRPAARSVWRQPVFLLGVAGALVFALLMAAVVVIRLATDTGQLIIESSEPGVEVAVKRSGEVVEAIKVNQQRQSFTIYSGSYEIELKGTRADQLQLDARQITLHRGEKVVVRISRSDGPVLGGQAAKSDVAKANNNVPESRPPSIPTHALAKKPEVAEKPDIAQTPDVPVKPDVPARPDVVETPVKEDPVPAPKLGKGPYALEFAGRDYVELADTNEVASWNRTFTAEMWVRWRADGSPQMLMGTLVRPPAIRTYGGWSLAVSSGEDSHFVIPTVDRSGGRFHVPLSDAPWHHVAYVHGEAGWGSSYIDGRRVSRGGQNYIDKGLSNLCLGISSNGGKKAEFHGAIRAFRFSSSARYDGAYEIPKRYEFEKDADTLILLDFSRPAGGAKIEDLSGNGHHGTIVGARWITIE